MRSPPPNAVKISQDQLLPLLEKLITYLRSTEEKEAAYFFDEIKACIGEADDSTDLMGPFMMLSTTAFRGFSFDYAASMLVDEVLANAQTLAATLSADETTRH